MISLWDLSEVSRKKRIREREKEREIEMEIEIGEKKSGKNGSFRVLLWANLFVKTYLTFSKALSGKRT